jgi:hypothetical protein
LNPRKFSKPIMTDTRTGEAERSRRLLKAMDGGTRVDPKAPGIHTGVGLISVSKYHGWANGVRRGIRQEAQSRAVKEVDKVLANKVLKPPGR